MNTYSNFLKNSKKKKAQVSIELIVILAVLIVGAIFVGIVIINSSNKNIDSASKTASSSEDVVNNFLNEVSNLNSSSNVNNVTNNNLDVLINSPSSSEDYNIAENDLIYFSATVDNNSGSYDCNWYVGSNLLYELQDTCYGANISLPDNNFPNAGNYVINVSVKDFNGNTANDDITISVVDNESTPELLSVEITSPTTSNSYSFTPGLNYTLNASVNNNSGDYSCDWNLIKNDNTNKNLFSLSNICQVIYTPECSDVGSDHNLIVDVINNSENVNDWINANILSLSSAINSPSNSLNYYVGDEIILSSSNLNIFGGINNLDCNWYLGDNLISSVCDDDTYILQERDVGNNQDLNLVITDTCTTLNKNINISVFSRGALTVLIDSITPGSANAGETINLDASYENNYGTVNCEWFLDNESIANGCNTVYDVTCNDINTFAYDLNVVATDDSSSSYSSKTFSVKGLIGGFFSPSSQTDFEVEESVNLKAFYSQENGNVSCTWKLDGQVIANVCDTTYTFDLSDVGQNKELKLILQDNCRMYIPSAKYLNITNNSSYNFAASVNEPVDNSTYNLDQTINFSTNYSGNIGQVSCVYEIKNSSNQIVHTYNTCSGTTTLSSPGEYTFNLTATDTSACLANPSACEVTDVSSVTILDPNIPDLTAEIVLPNHTTNAVIGSISEYEYQDFESMYDSENYQNPQCIWYRKESISGTPVEFLDSCNFSGFENNANMKDLGFIVDDGISKSYYISLKVIATPIAGGANQTYQTPYYVWTITKPSFTLQNPVNPYNFANGGGTLYTHVTPLNFPDISSYPPNSVKFTYFVNPEGNGICEDRSTLIFGNGIYSNGTYSKSFTSTELIPFVQTCNEQSSTYSCNYCLRVETLDGYAITDFENRVITNYNSDGK
ncbi:MAG: hypothetical protein PHR26_02520 [Candidatus ainarchaeum sp.]|nr:hypothetical protein [Candidatus ainarchaeum sp.]MDD3975557.1 hypothetical protein [Candidatus ainarchaeum sp.]